MDALSERGRARTLLVRASKTLTPDRHRVIADAVGVCRHTVLRARAREDAAVKIVARAVADPRFAGLEPWDLRSLPGWRRYRDRE